MGMHSYPASSSGTRIKIKGNCTVKIEKIVILEDSDNRCNFEESQYNRESGEYETVKHVGIAYHMGYTIICEDCFNAICEAKKVLDANKKIKSVEV